MCEHRLHDWLATVSRPYGVDADLQAGAPVGETKSCAIAGTAAAEYQARLSRGKQPLGQDYSAALAAGRTEDAKRNAGQLSGTLRRRRVMIGSRPSRIRAAASSHHWCVLLGCNSNRCRVALVPTQAMPHPPRLPRIVAKGSATPPRLLARTTQTRAKSARRRVQLRPVRRSPPIGVPCRTCGPKARQRQRALR
jgi:hypothetical protein